MRVRITLIEDDPTVNEALCIILKLSGFEVVTFLDDRDFIIEEHWIPDVYIIDRHLRGADGLFLCMQIKSMPATMHIPVIIISATPGIEDEARAKGADIFLEKPFSKKVLLDAIDRVLTKAY
jgi:DNA-binding response OmpR family regulator